MAVIPFFNATPIDFYVYLSKGLLSAKQLFRQSTTKAIALSKRVELPLLNRYLNTLPRCPQNPI